MNKSSIIILVIAAIVFCCLGFAIGQLAKAALIPTPGSDPLASKTYVDKLIAERTADLQNQLDELTARFLAMSGNLNEPIFDSDNGENTPVGTPNTSPHTTIKITASRVNVRSQPNNTSDILTRLNSGDIVDYLGEEGEFYKVKLPDGKEGYVANWLGIKQ